MSLATAQAEFAVFQGFVTRGEFAQATQKLNQLKAILIDFDSLPPISAETATAAAERKLARDVFEYAVILSISSRDKDAFGRSISTLHPYYTIQSIPDSDITPTVLGLNLLYLLVENRMADFHSALELLTDAQQQHPAIAFCTQLDQYLVVGAYDQVLEAAANPPVLLFSFFLADLQHAVRLNIAMGVAAAYSTLSAAAATKILMFNSEPETVTFIQENYPEWQVDGAHISLRASKASKSEEIPSLRLISQTLSYATELERIV